MPLLENLRARRLRANPGIPDVVSGDEAGLVGAGDVEGVANALTTVLRDADLAKRRSQAARRRLEQDFSVTAWVDRHIKIYRSLTET